MNFLSRFQIESAWRWAWFDEMDSRSRASHFLCRHNSFEKQFPLNCICFSTGRKQLREMKDISVPVLYWLLIPNYFCIRNTVVHIVAVKVLCTRLRMRLMCQFIDLVVPGVPCKSVSCSQVLYFTFGFLGELENQMNKHTHMRRGTWLIMRHRN